MSPDSSPQKAGGTPTLTVVPQGAQIATQDPLRGILGDLTDDLRLCVGGCGLQLLRYQVWQELDKQSRKRLIAVGVNRISSYGRCWKCAAENAPCVRSYSTKGTRLGAKVTDELLEKLPQIWEEVRSDGGGPQQLGDRLGVGRERARQLVSKYNLPREHAAKARAAMFLEELEHLAGLGQGVGYISKALQMEPDALVRKVNHLHQIGKTPVSFHGWTRHVENPQKEAA